MNAMKDSTQHFSDVRCVSRYDPRLPLTLGEQPVEIRTSIGYVSLTRAPGRRVEARLRGRRADDKELRRVLRLVGIPQHEAEVLASKLRHPSAAQKV